MGLRIQNNVEAFNAHRQLTGTASKAAKAMEKLSSGYRINRAADDAAGLAISEKMRAQIGGLAQAQRNAQDGVSLVQTAEGALNEVHSMLQRVRDLKVQYDNGTLTTDDKNAIAAEVKAARHRDQATSRRKTEFNGIELLDGVGRVHVPGRRRSAETIAIDSADLDRRQRRRRPRRSRATSTAVSGRRRQRSIARRHRRRDQERLDGACRLRRGAEPPRASPQQPRDLPGEPGGVREPDPRRGHGL